ncbi:reverse transcriptase domain-containing protein [Tanacetum coccineum]
MDNVNFPPLPSMVGTPKKRNMNKFCDYHQDRGHDTNDCYHLKKQIEEAVASGRLAHLVKDIRQSGQKGKAQPKERRRLSTWVLRRGQLPHGVIDLEVTMGEYGKTRTVIMKFAVVKSPSPYNALLDRTGMRSLRAIASTIYSMMKFPTSNGIATISITRETLRECRQIEEAQDLSRHARIMDPTLMQTSSEVTNPRVLLAPEETPPQRPGKEPMQLDDTEERRQLDMGRSLPWRRGKDSADMTGIPRAITEHNLDTYPHIEPKAQKKRSLAPDRRKVVTNEMTTKDEEKTGFHTEEGVFYYTKMPFGLKNAWATYQRLVDSAFKEQIGVNLEAYVDDMEGKFLGYIVTSEGIRANPEKAKAVMDMPSPKTLKQMQSLSGKLAALNRFLSKSVERSLPFLDTLKKCTNKKDFRWMEATEAAFLKMKKLVSELPTLTTPKKGETLMMYLAAANEAVSAVLLTERNGRQMPIHYVSRSLQGAKTNYAPMEKLALVLVHAARRLRRYFQAHPIKVITNNPIGQVLNNSGASRRLAKWAVELGAYGITYVPRVEIKGRVLADFLSDTLTKMNATPEVASNPRVEDIPKPSDARENLTPSPRSWRLYTDGASNNKGSRAGLILIASDDVEYSYTLHLNFSNFNNDAEYEALLAGLRIAKEMQVKDIHAFVDSKLVASQVEGSYDAKGARMVKYREKVLELAGAFNRFRITHIPRAENRKADALSKLAAVQFDHLSKEALIEVLNKYSAEAQEVNMVVEEEGPTWMTLIRNYLEEGKLPEDPADARTLMEKIGNYTIEDGVLYRKSYLVSLMRCVGPLQANYVIREVHMGSCGMHDGPRQVVAKAMNLGYFWPSMHRDARELIRVCDGCQAHAAVPRQPKADMILVTSAWPFMKWGMDIVGPLPEGPGRVKYLIVAIDYFTKWVEAKPLATITGKQVVNFAYDNIGNGAVERGNKSLLRRIKTRLEKGGSTWAEEVANVLWAHRTIKKTSNGKTPFSLTYGTEVVIPAELRHA